MPTALELGREGWKKFLKTDRHRTPIPGLTPSEPIEREQLLKRIRKAAHTIKKRFGVRRVVLFGSLAHEGWFAQDSDVDLAVEGLRGNDYWQAWRIVEDIIEDRLVDLIEIESSGQSLQRAIERYGVEL